MLKNTTGTVRSALSLAAGLSARPWRLVLVAIPLWLVAQPVASATTALDAVPQLISPIGVSDPFPTFEWTHVLGATEYRLRIETIDLRVARTFRYAAQTICGETLCRVRFRKAAAPGSYRWGVLARNTIDGGQVRSAWAEVSIQAAENEAPLVFAGEPVTASVSEVVWLKGSVSDDGQPDPPGSVKVQWRQLDGPGTTTFETPTSSETKARFSSAGDYLLELSASDGELSHQDQVNVVVHDRVTKLALRPTSSFDDAEESSDGVVNISSSDLELTIDASNQTVGIRFPRVDIPRGARVLSAYIQFTVDEPSSGSTDLAFHGEAADDAAPFAETRRNVSGRARTNATATTSLEAWPTIGAMGLEQRTPDISKIVQEIVDRRGWSSRNALAVIISGTGNRVAEAFDGQAAMAPVLHLEYVGSPETPSLPAFPGAEGFGAMASGGRGGRVIEVTNLNDRGPGSLRAALMATGPRIVVFRVAGTIELESPIRLEAAQSDLTYAGQTAPGQGITIRNKLAEGLDGGSPIFIDKDARNMIFRYLRSRPGPSTVPNTTNRAFTVTGQDVIVDHCSLSWSMDEVVNAWWTAGNVTFQWCIIGEGLDYSNYADGTHAVTFLAGDQMTSISLHHSLLLKGKYRQPRMKVQQGQIVNNVFYDSLHTNSRLDNEDQLGTAQYDYVGNVILRGPDSEYDVSLKVDDLTRKGIVSAYVRGNLDSNRPSDGLPDDLVVSEESKPYLVTVPHEFPAVTTTSADEAYTAVLAGAGANVPYRDAVDQRLVAEVETRSGVIIDAPGATTCIGLCPSHGVVLTPDDYERFGIMDPLDENGWPILASGTPPVDNDHDGMPDEWESVRGLDPSDPNDGNEIAPSGYTQIEEYINGLVPTPR